MSATQNSNRRIWPVALLLLLPFICVGLAFATRLQIDSDYFSLRFGPPSTAFASGGGASGTALPSTGGTVEATAGTNPSVDPTAGVATPESCFLGIVCLKAKADLNGDASGSAGFNAEVDGDGVDLNPQAEPGGLLDLDTDLDEEIEPDLDIDLDVLGNEVGIDIDPENGIDLDLGGLNLGLP